MALKHCAWCVKCTGWMCRGHSANVLGDLSGNILLAGFGLDETYYCGWVNGFKQSLFWRMAVETDFQVCA